jgi:hypothetical protein
MKTPLETIAEISRLVQKNPTISSSIWDTLTALRGPDFDPHSDSVIEFTGLPREIANDLKSATTGVLRYHFLKASGQEPFYMRSPTNDHAGNFAGSYYCQDSEALLFIRREAFRRWQRDETKIGHFLLHVKHAFEAMNLNWNEVNS